MDMSAIPGWLWFSADSVVDDCLSDVRRGRTPSVPRDRYEMIPILFRHLPLRYTKKFDPGRTKVARLIAPMPSQDLPTSNRAVMSTPPGEYRHLRREKPKALQLKRDARRQIGTEIQLDRSITDG
jgi:hypothetical protein